MWRAVPIVSAVAFTLIANSAPAACQPAALSVLTATVDTAYVRAQHVKRELRIPMRDGVRLFTLSTSRATRPTRTR